MDLRSRSAEQRQRDNARILADIAQRKRDQELAKQTMTSSSNTASSSTTTSTSSTSLVPAINSLILKGIENFSGADDQNVLEWLADLRDHFNAAHLSSEDARALISQYLTGDAKKWYQAERANLAELRWSAFKQALIQAFAPPAHEMKKLAKLLNRRQGPTESIQSYYFDIITLCRQYNSSMSDKDKIAHLINGLRPSLKTAVAMAEPESIQDFLHKAKTGEAVFSLDVPDTPTQTPTSGISETTAAIQHHRTNRTQRELPVFTNRQAQHVTPSYRPVSLRYPAPHPTHHFTGFPRVPQSYYLGTHQLRPRYTTSHFSTRAAYPRDTGSTISAVSPDFLSRIHHQPIRSTSSTCSTANNNQLTIRGRLSLQVRINNISTNIDVLVVDNLCTDLLLGSDWSHAYYVEINYRLGILTLSDTTGRRTYTRFLQPHTTTNRSFAVKTSRHLVILSAASVVISVSTDTMDTMAALFTPSEHFLAKHPLLIPHALVTVSNNTSFLSLLNPTNAPYTLTRGTILGKIQFLSTTNQYYYVNSTDVRHSNKFSPRSPTHIRPFVGNGYNCHVHHHSQCCTIKSPPENKSSRTELDSLSHLVKHLPHHQQILMKTVLNKYKNVFDTSVSSTINAGVFHRIPVRRDQPPIQSYPYRKAPKEREIINTQVADMLNKHIIRPSTSPWTSPVVIVKKKDGTPRFCVDYRRLNAVTERDVYPLPRIDDIIDRLAGSKFYSVFDLKQGYWQVPIAEHDKKKTAFVTTDGLFEFNVMSFGLSNAGATFQRLINSILSSLRWDIALVYLDDIIVYSPSFHTHLQHVARVLEVLDKANIKLNRDKCTLARHQIDYLGFRITQDGIKPLTANVKKTLDFPTPTSAAQAYSFVQMAQFYRRFISNFSSIAAPLLKFKQSNSTFLWTDECELAFTTIKNKLSQYPLLAFPNEIATLRLSVSTDASNVGIGDALHVITDRGERPVTFLSRTLSTAEQKYSTVEKECLAIIQHRSGTRNCVPDCLSQFPLNPPDTIADQRADHMHVPDNIVSAIQSSVFDTSMIGPAQLLDHRLKKLHTDLTNGTSTATYCVVNDVIHKIITRPGSTPLTLPLIPPSLVKPLLQAYHDHPTSGHLGVHKTWNKIRERFYWRKMFHDIKAYIAMCSKCQQHKISRRKPTGLLQPIELPSGAFELVGLDFLGPVPVSSSGNKCILVCTDYLTKWAITHATPDCTASTAAQFLVEKVILQYGTPRVLITDRGTHFTAQVFEAIATRCGVHHIKSTAYHAQTNGQTERFNATLSNSIATYVNQQQSDWDLYLPFCIFAYNTAKHESTHIPPFTLVYGRQAVLPFDVPKSTVTLSSPNDYYTQLIRFLREAKSTVLINLHRKQNLYKRRYDTGRHDQQLKIGQPVLLKQMMPQNLRKFSPKYLGPFIVTCQHGRLNYTIKNPTTDGSQVWICTHKLCNVTITIHEGAIIKTSLIKADGNHEFEHLQKMALNVYEKENGSAAAVPLFDRIKTSLYEYRSSQHPPIPKSLSTIDVPERLTRTLMGDHFLILS
ncbi:unnamed protein product [Rotaria sp. Silwood1]|nr:unnamed protein product [Rotaria sp. Silwood1]